jgi:hypothetical protein
VQWEIKYTDGTRERIEAEKYDYRCGHFLDETGEPVAIINMAHMKIVKIVKEDKKDHECRQK